MQTALFEEDELSGEGAAFEDVDELAEALVDSMGEHGEFLDELDAMGETDSLDELGDEFEDSMDELAGTDELDEMEDIDLDGMDEYDEFAQDGSSGLYLPNRSGSLITGPAAVAVSQRLNPFVLESLDADEADVFFRRIRRAVRRVGQGIRRVGRGVVRGVGAVGRRIAPIARRIGRVAGPLLRRALPMIQRVAGLAGPWGRVISAGLGAARGLIEGRGLRGALAGALSGAIPGIGGRIAGAVLGGDGADDDAALDALADMSDARQVAPGVALPLGAGLAARVATPRGIGAWPAALRRRARMAEQTMLRAARAAGGAAGRRLRVLRAIARMARAMVRRAPGLAAASQALPAAAASASRTVLDRLRNRPSAGASTPQAAVRRIAARRRILRQVPVEALFGGTAAAVPA